MDPIIDFLGFNIVLEIEFDFGSLVNGYFSFSDLKFIDHEATCSEQANRKKSVVPRNLGQCNRI